MAPIVEDQRKRDVAEADTVTAVKDILESVFGYDKYTEVTGEQAIRGTYVDLAVNVDGKVVLLIEVKSAGTKLDAHHLKQARDYGANHGNEWVILTNGIEWQVHRIIFSQPIESEKIADFDITALDLRKDDSIQLLFLLCKEALGVNALEGFHDHCKLLNRFTVGRLLVAEPVLKAVRKQFKRLFPDLKVSEAQLEELIFEQVIKRDIFDSDSANDAGKLIKTVTAKVNRAVAKKKAALVKLSEAVEVPPSDDAKPAQPEA